MSLNAGWVSLRNLVSGAVGSPSAPRDGAREPLFGSGTTGEGWSGSPSASDTRGRTSVDGRACRPCRGLSCHTSGMPRRTGRELVVATQEAISRASELLRVGDTRGAAEAAFEAFGTARAQRSHQLVSDTWLFLLDTLVADPDAASTIEYRTAVEGAFAWAETMPEEIQVWLFPALEPHLERSAFRRLVERARKRSASANAWLTEGNMNVRTRVQQFHLDDLRNDRLIEPRALALDRMAAFYADERFDPTGDLLRQSARQWRSAGRDDRADFLEGLADELAGRSTA